MNQPENASGSLPISDQPAPILDGQQPVLVPGWYKCLNCEDYGTCCNGPSLGSLGDIASAREFHKAMRKAKKKSIKEVAAAAPSISDYTVSEYFSNAAKDYKMTTVMAIDRALCSVCGNRIGLPPLDQSCPANSSEVRQQMAAADMKLAAAELRVAQSETAVADLQGKIIELKGKNAARIDQMQADFDKYLDFMRHEVKVWQRFSFALLILTIVMLICLVV